MVIPAHCQHLVTVAVSIKYGKLRNVWAFARFLLLNRHMAGKSLAELKTVTDEQSLITAAQENPARFAALYKDVAF